MESNIALRDDGLKINKTIIITFGIIVAFFGYLVEKNVQIPSSVILGFSAIAFFVLMGSTIRRPETPLYVLVAYLPFSRFLVGDFGGFMTAINFTNILTVIAIFAWVATTAATGKRFYTKTSLDIPLFIFMILGCLSLVRGIGYFGTAYASELIFPLKRWLTPMLFFFIFYNMINSKEEIKNITAIIMFVMTIAALMAIKDYIDIGNVSSLEKARVGGIAGQPNMLAAFFAYYMFIFAGFMLTYWRSFKHWLLFFPFLACFRGIQVTFSRGGYLAFIAAGLAISFFKNKTLFICVVLALIFAVLNPVVLPKGIQYRMSSTFRDDEVFVQGVDDVVDKSSLNRIEAWKGGIRMIKEKPLFGVGYGLFPLLIHKYASIGYIDAHNTYILIGAEMGLPTLITFILILLIMLKNAKVLFRETKDKFFQALALGFLGCIGGVLIANIFGGRLDSQEVSSYLWIMAALVFKALYFERRRADEEDD